MMMRMTAAELLNANHDNAALSRPFAPPRRYRRSSHLSATLIGVHQEAPVVIHPLLVHLHQLLGENASMMKRIPLLMLPLHLDLLRPRR